jgi:hypothetical protein
VTVVDTGAAPRLSGMDKLLPVWIAVAMVAGLLAGRWIPGLDTALSAVQVDGISLPIALGLLVMMYPVLAKVRYDRLGTVTRERRLLWPSLRTHHHARVHGRGQQLRTRHRRRDRDGPRWPLRCSPNSWRPKPDRVAHRDVYAPVSRSSMSVGPVGVQPSSSRVCVLVAERSMAKKPPIHP